MATQYDLIVIGSGAGLDVASGITQRGQKVAVIEKGRLGGTCLNRGCIPSKMLIHSADVVDTIKSAHLFGIKVRGYDVDFSSIIERVNRSVDHDSDEIEESLKHSDNPRLYQTECKFVGSKTIKVGNETIRADKILLASGGRPMIPTIDGLDGSGFITSDEALRLKKQPKVLTILGGDTLGSRWRISMVLSGHKLTSFKKTNSSLTEKMRILLVSSPRSSARSTMSSRTLSRRRYRRRRANSGSQ